MYGKRWIALGVAAALFLVSIAAGIIGNGSEENEMASGVGSFLGVSGEKFHENILEEGDGTGKIAVIHLSGVIQSEPSGGLLAAGYDHQLLLEQFDHAAEDSDVHGIILRVNTPGGGVVESDEIHDKVLEVQEEFGKPVYVSMAGTAASGGYYVAAPAEKIMANAQTLTGSLGVIMQSINYGELAEEWGVKTEVIKSGEFKDIMSSTRDMTDAERDILQALVDEAYEQFVDVIENGRDLDRDEVYELADGRVYTGSQALDLGLIDGVGHLDDTIEELIADIGRGQLSVVEYEADLGFPSFLGVAIQEMISNQQLSEVKGFLQQNQGPQLKFLYTD
ncbi:signal peptide peptidase SppA [Salipaludibacillus neizhouensis]|uniref:Signal peptide peptidase SppA n=1 Tax=Salipaludibacillus neizhouensis TaxID=885475 RepID=A0A3A9K8M6_9BACI|nr:signal peptide peptidase SppA [Salipaludibacillus neizhouensis]RKL66731.1 signal peptide peptidase SppA [Salipaludibacillus neizhouensis]